MAEAVVLIVDDERPILNYLKTILDTQGYKVITSMTGGDGLALAGSYAPDVILLDLGLPDFDGIDFLKKLRTWSGAAVIVVSARGHERDQIEALDAGGDDYLVKPFQAGALLARIRAAMRRASRPANELSVEDAERFECGPLIVDVVRRRVYVNETEIHLTPIEYRILLAFLKYPGRVLTHTFLQQSVWGHTNAEQVANLRVFVSSLRRKIQDERIDPPLIQTEIGVGYRFVECT